MARSDTDGEEPKHLKQSEANCIPRSLSIDQRTPVEDESAEGIERADHGLEEVPAVGWGVTEGREEAHRH